MLSDSWASRTWELITQISALEALAAVKHGAGRTAMTPPVVTIVNEIAHSLGHAGARLERVDVTRAVGEVIVPSGGLVFEPDDFAPNAV